MSPPHAGDPDVLATLCSLAFLPSDADIIQSTSDIQFQHGLLTADEQRNEHTLRILDSIAEILVSRPSREVLAIAFEHTPDVMNIYIAGNATLAPSTVPHLYHLWNELTIISNMYAETRTDPKWTEASPAMKPPIDILRHQIQFLQDVYLFSWRKLEKRLRRWVPKLEEFVRDLKTVQVDNLGLDPELVSLLRHPLNDIFSCAEDLKRLVDLTEANPLSSKAEWEELVFGLHKSSQEATKILEDKFLCERLAFVANNRAPMRLRRALEKCLSLPRHADNLLKFAHSPRLRHMFEKKFIVHEVAPEATAVSWPPSLDWQEVHTQITSALPASDAIKKMPKIPRTLVSHCECTLIAHIHNRPITEQAPFTYIGVSKLSCKACYAFMLAYNRLKERPKFYTKGCHDKWYPGWCMPKFSDAETNERMSCEVAKEIIDMYRSFTEKQRGLSASDSTDASTDGDNQSSFGDVELPIRRRPLKERADYFRS